MKALHDKSLRRRAWLACAVLGVAFGLIWGCLNPRPDVDPSSIDVPEPSSGEDFCRDNPLAADCDDTGNDGPGNMVDPSQNGGNEDPNEPTDPPVSEPESDVDAGGRDAGPPDAGPNANK